MEYYLTLKLIHILAAVVVTGTGAGIAFFMFMANRSNNTQAIYVTAQHDFTFISYSTRSGR